jgi:hypothetical protein
MILLLDFILGHPFLNALVSHPHNFYDEELVDIYVAFLKSLALQLTPDTVNFFLNPVRFLI